MTTRAATYRVTFKRPLADSRMEQILADITAVDYHNQCLYFSNGDMTFCFHIDEIEHSERISDFTTLEWN